MKIILFVCILLFFGCGESEITSGRVISVYYLPPHNEEVMKVAYGSSVSFVWVNEYVPDTTYYISFRKGKHKREILVGKTDYYLYNIGDNIELSK